jgi:hypothetical protein
MLFTKRLASVSFVAVGWVAVGWVTIVLFVRAEFLFALTIFIDLFRSNSIMNFHVIPFSACEFSVNRCSDSHSTLGGVTDIPPPFHFYLRWKISVHEMFTKLYYAFVNFVIIVTRTRHFTLGGCVNEFLFVFSLCIARFWWNSAADVGAG